MPAIRPGFLVETPVTTFGLGRSDSTAARLIYSSSPFYNGTTRDEDIRKSFFQPAELSSDGKLNDGGYAFGTTDRYYQQTPNLNEVPVGGGGLPGSPYGPNIATPTRGHDPSSIPASGVEAAQRLASRSAGAWVGNSLKSPHESTLSIIDPTQRRLGVGSGNSFVVRIS